ncbi:MAG: class I SAM-dependent methyltransferase [Promethearchaeota archaeon]
MGIKEKLREQLKNELSEEELDLLPSGYQSLGKTIIIKLNPRLLEQRFKIGQAYLKIFPTMRNVYLNRGIIRGKFRVPENMEFLAGEENPIVVHKENGIIYKFDITKIMFSKGNVRERKYLSTLVQPDEIIVDMFAGIGYFSLPIAVHSPVKKIYSIELNPIAFQYLKENIKLNYVEDKIIPILGDCREEVVKLSNSGVRADRVIMGVFPAPRDYIEQALTLTKESGTVFHYEGVVKKDEEDYLNLYEDFKKKASELQLKCELKEKRNVKSYGPGLYHIVLDILIQK